jgi:hypothetical protein
MQAASTGSKMRLLPTWVSAAHSFANTPRLLIFLVYAPHGRPYETFGDFSESPLEVTSIHFSESTALVLVPLCTDTDDSRLDLRLGFNN